jgi:hypothetical protein
MILRLLSTRHNEAIPFDRLCSSLSVSTVPAYHIYTLDRRTGRLPLLWAFR